MITGSTISVDHFVDGLEDLFRILILQGDLNLAWSWISEAGVNLSSAGPYCLFLATIAGSTMSVDHMWLTLNASSESELCNLILIWP